MHMQKYMNIVNVLNERYNLISNNVFNATRIPCSNPFIKIIDKREINKNIDNSFIITKLGIFEDTSMIFQRDKKRFWIPFK